MTTRLRASIPTAPDRLTRSASRADPEHELGLTLLVPRLTADTIAA